MKNATPKNKKDILSKYEGVKDDKNVLEIKKYLSDYFSLDNGYYIQKALAVLHQFQAGNLKAKKKIQRKDIYNTSPLELSVVLSGLENAFGTPILIKVIEPNEDALQVESAEMLNLAISFLEELNITNNKFLTIKDNVFYYHNTKLRLSKASHTFRLLKVIFNYRNGDSFRISYIDLCKETRKQYSNVFKDKDDDFITTLFQKYITTKTGTFGKQLHDEEPNGKKLVEVIKNFGIDFNNTP